MPAGLPDPPTSPLPDPEVLPPAAWLARGTAAYRRMSLGLFLAGFASFSLLYCVQPLLPVFAAEFQVGPAVSSLALSLSTGLLSVAIVVAGALSEGVGRRGLIFGSICGAAVLNLGVALAPSWPVLLVGRALVGVVLGGVPAVAMAYIAEEVSPGNLGFAMGLYVGGNAFGGMTGRVGTAALVDVASWRWALGIITVVDLCAAVGFLVLLPRSQHFVRRRGLGARFHLRAFGGHLRHPRLPRLFMTSFLLMGAFISVYNYTGFRLHQAPYGLSHSQIGLIFIAYLFGITGSSIAGGLADRLGRRPVLIGGVVTAGAGVALTLTHPLVAIVGGIVVLTLGFFVAHSAASGWVGRLANEGKGHAASLYLLGYYAGSSILGSAGGWFWEHGGWPGEAAYTGTLLAIALGLALSLSDAPTGATEATLSG